MASLAEPRPESADAKFSPGSPEAAARVVSFAPADHDHSVGGRVAGAEETRLYVHLRTAAFGSARKVRMGVA